MTSLLFGIYQNERIVGNCPAKVKGVALRATKIHFQRRDRDNLGSRNHRGQTGIYQHVLMPPFNDRADNQPCAQLIANSLHYSLHNQGFS